MEFCIRENGIEIFGKQDFCPEHILECGQIFSYEKKNDGYVVLSGCEKAEIQQTHTGFLILTSNPQYFVHFFDLETDYSSIKKSLSKHKMLQQPILFGYGIRILKQNLFETLISFIISANNNIKRIQLILGRIRKTYGTCMGDFHAFPTREQLLCASKEDFQKLGAGYRAEYLCKVLEQVNEQKLQSFASLSTVDLRKQLISLAGVGPKVADCVLLFGYGRGDVFPVDTWMEKMYNKFFGEQNLSGGKQNREQISRFLVSEFGELSGYAQQYLFYFMRSN